MSDSIEFTQLMAGTSAHGGDRRLAETLRTEFLTRDPDDIATTTAAEPDGSVIITSGGKPMTVGQVQAELQVLILGE